MSVFVFLGPSLNLDIAKTIYPNAKYLPPISCGNIIQVIELKAKTIVIIDGYFENQPAVWHKEILYALSQGINVYGASSMGALRAAELAEFGMIGFGEIFNQYRSGSITDDDEVALIHLSESEDFLPCSIPMINLRFTIQFALQCKVITPSFASEFLNIAKQIFYQERTESRLKSKCKHLEEMGSFFDWFSNNYIDQKMLDTKNLLINLQLKNNKAEKVSNLHRNNFNSTALFRNLKIESLSKPLPFFYTWLPMNNKINSIARLFDEYSISKQLAKVIGVAHDCGFLKIDGQTVSFVYALPDNNMVTTVFDYFLKLSTQNYTNKITKASLKLLAQILTNLYLNTNKFFQVTPASILQLSRLFYQKAKINSEQDFRVWLQKNNMNVNQFKTAISLFYFFDYFIVRNNLSTIVKSQNTNCIDYFSIAISLNKLDKQIIKTLTLNKDELVEKSKKMLAANGHLYAISQDFITSSAMDDFIHKIANLDTDWIMASSPMSWKLQ